MGHPTFTRKPVPGGDSCPLSIPLISARRCGMRSRRRMSSAARLAIGLALGLLLAAPVAGAAPEQVLRSDETGVRFTVEVPPVTWTAHDLRGDGPGHRRRGDRVQEGCAPPAVTAEKRSWPERALKD